MDNIFCILFLLLYDVILPLDRSYRFTGKMILTTGLNMNIDEVVYLYYALFIKIRLVFICILTIV